MSRLIITRSNEWNNMARNMNIYVDGQKIGNIANGETKQFEVLPGAHTLSAKIDWAGSQDMPLEIADGQTKTFILSGFKSGAFIIPLLCMLLAAYAVFRTFIIMALAAMMFLVVIYYLTIGRKDYLVLKQIS